MLSWDLVRQRFVRREPAIGVGVTLLWGGQIRIHRIGGIRYGTSGVRAVLLKGLIHMTSDKPHEKGGRHNNYVISAPRVGAPTRLRLVILFFPMAGRDARIADQPSLEAGLVKP